jgi:ribosomal protein S18 acetylase RimI-like enzyme
MSEAAIIRAFETGDAVEVVALWTEVFRDDSPHNEPAAMIRRKLGVQPELFLVAVRSAAIVGTVLGGYDGVRGWVHHLAVVPALQRLGIGRALMCAVEEGLAAFGCPKLNLQVRAGNEAVVAFYERLGYSIEPRVSMGKRLAPRGS